MPYGTPLSNEERIIRHQTLYGFGEYPPETRLRSQQVMIPSEVNENTDLMILTGILIAGWVFVDFVLPRLMDK